MSKKQQHPHKQTVNAASTVVIEKDTIHRNKHSQKERKKKHFVERRMRAQAKNPVISKTKNI